jgi:Zn-dependent protease
MKDSLRLGRIAGVRVGLHWSLGVIVVLVALGLANNRFPYDAAGYSTTAYDVAGAITAVGLLAGVLLHELGHALVARRLKLIVDGITLSWMGGVTRIEGDTRTAGNELMVAGVGPLTSAVAGGLLWLARIGAAHAGVGALAVAALGWLAWINIALAIFNILPAAPLDGGRVLHALVWAARRDRWKATRAAAGIGVLFGAGTVVFGLIITERGSGQLFNGLLIGFIGWWLLASARAELAAGSLQRALEGRRMDQVMRPVGEAPGWITVRTFVEQYSSRRPGWVWLLRDWNGGYAGALIGDAITAVPWTQWDLARPLDFSLPLGSTSGAAPDEEALTVLERAAAAEVVFVVAGGQTLGAVLPRDIEAMAQEGARLVRGGRPAHGPVG